MSTRQPRPPSSTRRQHVDSTLAPVPPAPVAAHTPTSATTRPPISDRAAKQRAGAARNGNRLGAIPTYSQAKADAVFDAMYDGLGVVPACKRAGVGSSTWYRWLIDPQRYGAPAELWDRFARARVARLQRRADELEATAESAAKPPEGANPMAHVAAVKLMVDTVKWELSKLVPEQFGDRLHIDGAGSRAEIHVYLPAKAGGSPGDGARVVNGTARALSDESSDE